MKLMDVKTAEAASKRVPARDRLLAAADELFYAEGVHVVGVDRIVARAGVTKASLYNTFGSKDGLVRAYLENHFSRRQRRVAKILAEHTTPRARLLAVFDEVEGMLAGSAFRGCRFISAAAESAPGEAGEVVAEQYRAWLWSLFTELAEAAGARDAKQVGRQLFLLYDGAAVAARMDDDRAAAARAVRSAVIALLEAAIPEKS
jgi:AcrR family transcriptional regulator